MRRGDCNGRATRRSSPENPGTAYLLPTNRPGSEDHIHIYCNLSRTITIAKLVEEAKTEPSKWMKEQGAAYMDFFTWTSSGKADTDHSTWTRNV
jgi:hypothetical protein